MLRSLRLRGAFCAGRQRRQPALPEAEDTPLTWGDTVCAALLGWTLGLPANVDLNSLR